MKIESFKGYFRFLSNFWLAEVEFEETTYPCVENAYQAAKTLDLETRKLFLGLTPGQAKAKGRSLEIRPDWESIKIPVMTQLVRSKFQHPILKKQLLDTGDFELIEGNTWGDTFWGVCNGKGENNLGKILMKIREEYRDAMVERF
jgi:ribA/ribD-fused uncharacterized protein